MKERPILFSGEMVRATLDLPAAAALLHVHPHTLECWARTGHVPAAKPGRRWVFIEDDLLHWLREWRGRKQEETACRSTNAAAPGGASGASAVRELEKALAHPTGKRRRNTTTAAVLPFGAKHI